MSTKRRAGYVPYVQRTSPDASPTTAPTEIRSEPSSRWMSPAPQPSTFSSWTPALDPIVGSPSIPQPLDIPQPVDYPPRERDEELDQYEQERDVRSSDRSLQRDIEQGAPDATSGEREDVQPPRTRGFVGGFIAELKKLPVWMAKNNPRVGDVAADGVTPSPRISYYSSRSPSVRNSPLPSQITQSQYRPSTVPIEELYESEASDGASQVYPAYEERWRYDNYDGTTAVHEPMDGHATDPSVMSTPLQVGSTDIADYEKTNTPYPFTNPEDKTLRSYVDRIHRLFTDIYYLPWVSIQVAADYFPAEDSLRGRYRKSEPVSWYSPKRPKEKPEVDLMASPTSSLSPPPMIQTIPPTPTLSHIYSNFSGITRSAVPSDGRLTLTASQYTYAPTHTHRSHSRVPSESGTAFREIRSPGIATVSAAYTSPGMSSHGAGRHSISESVYYASPSAQRPFPSVASALSSPPQDRLDPRYYGPKY
ncbi:hypothetical protein BXZ70DRAFT_930020 [Cristinia sonorae]|uniref:Uncharacterized protein n=1 Tax=Cristinia sonorae TaxID=1940300 RepID=A0A8K0XR45_9AGAR|nr:hypothetical protein BXZ70DRAFT_930020 [Cristinia sonorae]